jgi:hypothetical protein
MTDPTDRGDDDADERGPGSDARDGSDRPASPGSEAQQPRG